MTLARIQEIADALEAGEELSPADRAVLVAAARRAPAVPLRHAIAERDRLIRLYHRKYVWDAPSIRSAALKIELDAKRYAAGEWRHHRKAARCPPVIENTPRELLWLAFRAAPTFPQVRQIIEIIR